MSSRSKSARFRVSTLGGLTSLGSALDGEVEDYLVPTVQSLVIVGFTDANGKLHLQWNTVAGQRYEVQTSTNLVNWTTVETITASSETAFYTSPNPVTASPHLFYRVRRLP